MESDSRRRYNVARDALSAMKTSTTSAEFSTALLHFLTFGRSVLSVAGAETAKSGVRQPMKQRIELAEKEPLIAFFIGERNAALKENRYRRMVTTVSIEPPAVRIQLQVAADDVLVSPSRGIDESKEPREQVLQIEVREGRPPEGGPAAIRQEFYSASGPFSGQSVIGLSEQLLGHLEKIVNQVEELVTNPSSGSAR